MVFYELKPRRKGSREIIYPETRELFLFTRKVLSVGRKKGEKEVSASEIGEILSADYKFAHQWQFGKRRMVDIGELLELAEKLDVPYFFIQKIALGVWDAEKAWRIYQSYKKGWEEIEKTVEIGTYRIRVKVRVPPEEKGDAEKQVQQVLRSLEEEMEHHPEHLEEIALREVSLIEGFLSEHHYARLGAEEEQEGSRRKKRKREKEEAQETAE